MISEMNRVPLSIGKNGERAPDVFDDFMLGDFFMNMRPCLTPPIRLLGETIAGPVVCFPSAQTVDGATARQGNNPSKRPSLRRFIAGRMVPYFHEDLLEKILHIRFIMKNCSADLSEQAGVSILQQAHSFPDASLEHLHELFVGRDQAVFRCGLGDRGDMRC